MDAEVYPRIGSKQRIGEHHPCKPPPADGERREQEDAETRRGMARHRSHQAAQIPLDRMQIRQHILRMRGTEVGDIPLEKVAHLVAKSYTQPHEKQREKHILPPVVTINDIKHRQVKRYPVRYSGCEPHDGIHHGAAVEIKGEHDAPVQFIHICLSIYCTLSFRRSDRRRQNWK